MGRGRGRGKVRSGGKMFVANIEELQMREAQVEEAKAKRKSRRGDSDDEGDDEEEGSGDEPDVKVDTKDDLRELANFERAARLQKASGAAAEQEEEEEEEEKPRGGLMQGFQTANANHGSKNPKQMKTKDMLKSMGEEAAVEPQLSRKEREALEAQRKKADYERRHAAGETAEAKADLARLAEVRRRRDEAKAKREKEESRQKLAEAGLPPASDDEDSGSDSDEEDAPKKSKLSAEKKAANLAKKKAAAGEDASDSIPVLTSIEIKKLKPDVLKEHLKTRGLSVQGQKKELIQRLIDHEAGRA